VKDNIRNCLLAFPRTDSNYSTPDVSGWYSSLVGETQSLEPIICSGCWVLDVAPVKYRRIVGFENVLDEL
jgi:hypothetical protein